MTPTQPCDILMLVSLVYSCDSIFQHIITYNVCTYEVFRVLKLILIQLNFLQGNLTNFYALKQVKKYLSVPKKKGFATELLHQLH